MVTAKTVLRILSYAYYVYFITVQPWLCWFLWDWRVLRPFILYIVSLYPILFTNLVFAICVAAFATFEKHFGNKYHNRFSEFITWGFYIFARIFFGYEVHGKERLKMKGALIVYYHGVYPLDVGFLHSYSVTEYGIHLTGIVDRALFNIPVICDVMSFFGQHCCRERLAETLRSGGVGMVAPGGSYEALMSQNGTLEWRNRIGFAEIAKETGVAVIPMFTVNISQFMSLFKFGEQGNEILKRWYLLARLPLAIPKHVLPVKLRTYLGEPLYCGEDETPQEFANRVKAAIELLRDTHQRQPSSVIAAVLERFGIRW